MIEPALSELPELTAADLSEERWADWLLTRLGLHSSPLRNGCAERRSSGRSCGRSITTASITNRIAWSIASSRVLLLWHHWDEPDIYWFSGSHLAPFRRGLLLAAILEHVGRCVGTAAQRRASARRTDAGWRAGEDHVAG